MKTPKTGQQKTATYAVLTACLLAAGIGAWGAAVGKQENGKPQVAETTFASPSNIPSDEAAVNVPVTGVPYETTMPTEPETETETEKEPSYIMPLGEFITKDYSDGKVVYSNTMRDWRAHNGIDFGDNRGQSVLAIADGTVLDVQTDVLWGTVLTIDHGEGVVSKYCGLEKDSTPEPGTAVEKGVVVGKLGEIPIESKDGPHLHFEITVNGKQKDPLKWLRTS